MTTNPVNYQGVLMRINLSLTNGLERHELSHSKFLAAKTAEFNAARLNDVALETATAVMLLFLHHLIHTPN